MARAVTTLFLVWFTGMCLYASVLWQGDQAKFDELAVEAQGVVVDIQYRTMSGNGGRVTADPEVVFETRDGELISFIDTSAIDMGVVIGE